VIALIVGLVLLVFGGGIMAVLAVYGTRKYIQQAKVAEARNTLGVISRAARMSYEEEQPDGGHRLCRSASQPVPASASMIRGKKYMSTSSDWARDRAKDAGFACLKVELAMPQYFQYEYEATATTFVARAHGDLNGDGVLSTFEIRGEVVGGAVVVAPNIREVDPAE